MQHHFDVDKAKQFGVLEAIILSFVEYFGEEYCTEYPEFFTQIIPYASRTKIKHALEHLEKEGALKRGGTQ